MKFTKIFAITALISITAGCATVDWSRYSDEVSALRRIESSEINAYKTEVGYDELKSAIDFKTITGEDRTNSTTRYYMHKKNDNNYEWISPNKNDDYATIYTYKKHVDPVTRRSSEFIDIGPHLSLRCDTNYFSIEGGTHVVLSSGAIEYRVNNKVGKAKGSKLRLSSSHAASFSQYPAGIPKYFKGVNEAAFRLDGYSTSPLVEVDLSELGRFVSSLPANACKPMKRVYNGTYEPVKQYVSPNLEVQKAELKKHDAVIDAIKEKYRPQFKAIHDKY